MCLVPKASYVLREDWDAMGMAATGSGTIVIAEELFVPDDHFSTPQILISRLAELKQIGPGLRPGGLGRSIMVGTGNAVGMAEHALEVFLEGVGKKPIAYSPYNRQQDAPVTHLNVGYVQMQIKAARCVAEAALDDLDRLHETGGDVTPADTVRYHADTAYVWDTCATASETLFKASGASGISKKQPLQLIARNCRAGSMARGAQHPDLHGELWPPDLRGAEQGHLGQRARTRRLTPCRRRFDSHDDFGRRRRFAPGLRPGRHACARPAGQAKRDAAQDLARAAVAGRCGGARGRGRPDPGAGGWRPFRSRERHR